MSDNKHALIHNNAAGFSNEVGFDEGGYFDALLRMFEQALKAMPKLQELQRPAFWQRVDTVRRISHKFSYGIGAEMDFLLAEYGVDG